MSLVTDGIGGGNIITEGFGFTSEIIITPPVPFRQVAGGWIDVDRKPIEQVRLRVEFPLSIKSNLSAHQQSRVRIKSSLIAYIQTNLKIDSTLFKKIQSEFKLTGKLSSKLTSKLHINGEKDYKKLLTLLSETIDVIDEEEEL